MTPRIQPFRDQQYKWLIMDIDLFEIFIQSYFRAQIESFTAS